MVWSCYSFFIDIKIHSCNTGNYRLKKEHWGHLIPTTGQLTRNLRPHSGSWGRSVEERKRRTPHWELWRLRETLGNTHTYTVILANVFTNINTYILRYSQKQENTFEIHFLTSLMTPGVRLERLVLKSSWKKNMFAQKKDRFSTERAPSTGRLTLSPAAEMLSWKRPSSWAAATMGLKTWSGSKHKHSWCSTRTKLDQQITWLLSEAGLKVKT